MGKRQAGNERENRGLRRCEVLQAKNRDENDECATRDDAAGTPVGGRTLIMSEQEAECRTDQGDQAENGAEGDHRRRKVHDVPSLQHERRTMRTPGPPSRSTDSISEVAAKR